MLNQAVISESTPKIIVNSGYLKDHNMLDKYCEINGFGDEIKEMLSNDKQVIIRLDCEQAILIGLNRGHFDY